MITSETIGERVKQYRLNQNISQESLAELAGLSRTAIIKAEKGLSGLDTYLAIMKALGRIDALEAAFPEEAISPVQLVERNKRKRQRAYTSEKSKNLNENKQELDW
ncbi:helix-turn-helix transcriptional regulator [Thalassomonas haliotis]|uniref:Helix-turn-helix transcriptional regulator n=1 Tax=Thalassomonas haliotis TaxID=485448 RepID=A0ABY7VFS5_9GAMM|nr:helix-turn-helix transcriptional regulator [Thalassomonas haliotis]WDE12009.1 helix-turn-helix transcriptional regulator [Thalassomonas haliotis]